MYCANCGKQINDDATYCVWCGAPVEPFGRAGTAYGTVAAQEGTSKRKLIIAAAVAAGVLAIAAILLWTFLGDDGQETEDPGMAPSAGSELSYDQDSADSAGAGAGYEGSVSGYQDDYLPESSDRYISASDVENFSRNDLNYAINELYARHGATFTDDDVIAYFSGKSWYSPSKSKEAARSEFSEIEEKNFLFLCDYRDSKYPN